MHRDPKVVRNKIDFDKLTSYPVYNLDSFVTAVNAAVQQFY